MMQQHGPRLEQPCCSLSAQPSAVPLSPRAYCSWP
jgi:hypothetical protein